MPALPMIITDAGLAAIVDAQEGGTEAILIAEIGLSNVPFVMAPTLTALPGEFRRLDTVSGQTAAENVIHVVAYDAAAITYDVTGFGLYDAEGTLIAVHSAVTDPIISKAQLATSLFAIDIALSADIAAVIEFGDALFLNPPATEDYAGVVKLATEALADEAEDEWTAITPALVKRMIDNALRNKIMIWSGTIATIPEGWLLCDGTNGTPDMTDIFVMGAGGAYDPGDTGGSVQHDHGGTQGHALTEAQIPDHRHMTAVAGIGAAALTAANSIWEASNSGGDTEYSLDGNANEPTIGRTSSIGGGEPHDHDIANANHLPPYFALAYIMKA